jgi:NTE family protein
VKGNELKPWTRPQRRTEMGPITIDHIMASSALPIFFPAIRMGNEYYGDGGIRLAAPLSPALHLGADRILAISTRYDKNKEESDTAAVVGYPPPAQVLGVLLNAVFLDLIDQDSLRLETVNKLVEKMPLDKRDGMRPISFLNVRPTQDLGALAKGYEDRLPRLFRWMVRGLGTSEQKSPDVLSMLLFEPEYLNKLMSLGEADAERRGEELHKFLNEELTPDAVVTKAKLA